MQFLAPGKGFEPLKAKWELPAKPKKQLVFWKDRLEIYLQS
jgi:hypothetical protein